MKKFTTIIDTAVPLPIQNVDTDQIIPSRFLKFTSKEGFGNYLFYDWRYDKKGKPISSFVLNNPLYNESKILVTGENFGNGSSREHAAWAIAGYGFQVIVSSFFADIFKNNVMNNFVLPVVVSENFLVEIFNSFSNNPKVTLKIDLENQKIINHMTENSEHFLISPFKKRCFLNGFDDIDYLLNNKVKIEEYERKNCEN